MAMQCAYHPDREPMGTCVECGRLICTECKTVLGGKFYCPPCADKVFVYRSEEAEPAATAKTGASVSPAKEPLGAAKTEASVSPAKEPLAVAKTEVSLSPAKEPLATPPSAPKGPAGVNPLWWLAVAFGGWIGGLIAWLLNKNRQPKTSKYMLVSGIGWSALQVVMTVVVLFSMNVSPAHGTINYANIPGPKEQNPFTLDYETNDSNISYYTHGDSIITLVYASPFYSGMQPLPGQKTSEYENAFANKVTEMRQEAQTIVQAVGRIKPQVVAMRSAYLSYMDTCLRNEKKLQAFTADTMNVMLELAADELSVEAQLNCVQSAQHVNSYFDSFNSYVQVAKSVELGSLYLQDVNTLLSYAGLARVALDSSSNSTIKAANSQLDRDMTALDPLKDDLSKIAGSIQKIDYGLKQLETGSYYFGLAAEDYMQSSLPDLKAKVSSLTPNKYLTQDEIDLAQSYVSVLEKWNSGLREQLNSADQKDLIKISDEEPTDYGWSSPAYAYSVAFEGYSKAYKSVSAPAVAPADSPGYLSKGWNFVKSTVHGVQYAAGGVIDALDATVKNAWLMPVGLYEGVPLKGIAQGWKENYSQVVTNFNNGVSGSSVYHDATKFWENQENNVSSAVQSVAGTGIGGQLAGFLAKSTVGLFTGFAKGVYKLADPTSTAGDYVSGTFDVVGSCIGGSKVILKGSQIPGLVKGLATEADLVSQKVIKVLATDSLKAGKDQVLTELGESATKSYIDGIDQIIQASEQEGSHLTQQITSLFSQGVESGLKSSSTTIKKTLESKFTTELNTVGETIVEVIGKDELSGKLSAEKFFDNMVGSYFNSNIKALVKNGIDNGVISVANSSGTGQQQASATGQQPTTPQGQGETSQGVQLPPILKLSSGSFASGSGSFSFEGSNNGDASEFLNKLVAPILEQVVINIDQNGKVSANQNVNVVNLSATTGMVGTATVTINGQCNNGTIYGAYNINGNFTVTQGAESLPMDLKYGGHVSSAQILMLPKISDSVKLSFSGPVKSTGLIKLIQEIGQVAESIAQGWGGDSSSAGSQPPPVTPTSDVVCNSYTAEVVYKISTQ